MIYLLLLLILMLLGLGYFKVAEYYGIQDKPNNRSSHQKPTLLGGGVIFIFALLLYSIFFGWNYPWLLLGATILATVSYIDDIKPLSPRIRIIVHIISLCILFIDLNLYSIFLPYVILILIFSVGVLNAYNFMDGINGMMGMTSMVVLAGMVWINSQVVYFVDSNLLYTMLIAVVLFNFFNFRTNAYCFAGDVGAFSMGIIMVFLLIRLVVVSGNIAWIAMLALFGVDTLLTIIHRLCLGENILHPHRKHLFQILANELRVPHVHISAAYGLIQLLIIIGLILSDQYSLIVAVAAIFALSLFYMLIKGKYFHLHCKKAGE